MESSTWKSHSYHLGTVWSELQNCSEFPPKMRMRTVLPHQVPEKPGWFSTGKGHIARKQSRHIIIAFQPCGHLQASRSRTETVGVALGQPTILKSSPLLESLWIEQFVTMKKVLVSSPLSSEMSPLSQTCKSCTQPSFYFKPVTGQQLGTQSVSSRHLGSCVDQKLNEHPCWERRRPGIWTPASSNGGTHPLKTSPYTTSCSSSTCDLLENNLATPTRSLGEFT